MGRTRRLTTPGIGKQESGVQPRQRRATTDPPTSGVTCPSPLITGRPPPTDPEAALAFRATEAPPSYEEPMTTTAKGSSKPAPKAMVPVDPQASTKRERKSVRIDEVGDGALGYSAAPDQARPRMLRERHALGNAPIDHRDAFVLSLIDGQMTVGSLVDVAGMPEAEVKAILARLARLGIIAL